MNSFKGALFLNGSAKSVPVRVSFEFDSLRFLLEDGKDFEASFSMTKLSSGGFENRLIEIKAVSKDENAIICYIDLEDVDAFLEAAQHPGISLDKSQISNIRRTLRTDRTISFLTDWGIYLLAAIIAAIYLIISFLPN